MEKQNHRQYFINAIWKENPLFVLLLGLCPALGVTQNIESAIGMGLMFTFVLLGSNIMVSLLRKFIPEEVETPAYIVIIATFVTVVKMFTEAFIPALDTAIGTFISLLVVNCIVLGRAEAFAKSNGVVDSILDALGNGVGYTIAILIIAACREILGTGVITLGAKFSFLQINGENIIIPILNWSKFGGADLSISFFQDAAGGFTVLGVALAIIAGVKNAKKAKEAAAKKAAADKAKAAAAAPAAAAPKGGK